jgi:hypothetical protein
MSALIVGLPEAFAPPWAAASMTRAPAAMLPLTSTSVRLLRPLLTTAFMAVLLLHFFDCPMFDECEDIMVELRRVLVVWNLQLRFANF